jgi:hypothetical protein
LDSAPDLLALAAEVEAPDEAEAGAEAEAERVSEGGRRPSL